MKKLFLLLLVFCITSSINCMNKKTRKEKTQCVFKQTTQEISDLDILKSMLPQTVINQIEKIEKWPKWAKQSAAFTLSSAYLIAYVSLIEYCYS